MIMNNKPLVLIMCGGRSLRLWPLSEYKSKNFIDIFGFSPLELTIKRFLKITSRERIFLVASIREKSALSKLKSIPQTNIIYEPDSKNTAAAVYLSALTLAKKFSLKDNLIISPVDNLIQQEKKFYQGLNTALQTSSKGFICTIGLKANKPTVHFGYIQASKQETKGVFLVKQFVEKPSIDKAKQLIKQGNVFYNSGMVIAGLGTLLAECKKYYLDHGKFSLKLSLAKIYKQLEDIPFDKAVLEKSKNIRLVKGQYQWHDFGNWNTIHEILPKDGQGNVNKANAFLDQAKNNCLYQYGVRKKVLVAGLDKILFVDTPLYTLLISRDYLDSLKSAVKKLKKK